MTRFQPWLTAGIVLCVGAVTLSGCAASRSVPLSMNDEQRVYEQAIEAAAVRGSGWDAPLWPLADGTLSVSTFTEDAELDTRTLNIWVAPTRELWQRCQGKADTVLALQQILGLPPQRNPQPGNQWRVFIFDVDSRDLFRPCPGGVDPKAPPERPRCRLASDIDPKLDEEFTRFLLQQWWLSHRATVERGHDPELGYPWTGMGWTYDWNPSSSTHRGVSEFVLKRHAALNKLRSVTPQGFCNAAAPGPN